MASASAIQQARETCRLRIVHYHEIPAFPEQIRVLFERRQVKAAEAGREFDLHPLQAVVQFLGELEEVVAALEHMPLGLEAETAQQRDKAVQELGHAPAVRRGIEV